MVNSIRFSGLASGMDTQSMVDSIMKAQRIPLDNIYKKKQQLEWKRDDYRSMNLALKELDDFIFNGIFKKSNVTKKSTTVSNSDLVTATASADAANVSYKIENVKLATAARKQSTDGVSSSLSNKIDSSKSLRSQMGKFADEEFTFQTETLKDTLTVPENSSGEFQLSKRDISVVAGDKITVGGKEFTVRTNAITEGNPLGEQEVLVDQSTGKIKFGSDLAAGSSFEVSFTNHFLEFDVKTFNENGEAQYKNFKFDGSTSLDNMFSTINKANAGVNLFYDSGKDKVVAMRTETGNFNLAGDEIEFVNVTRDENGEITSETTNTFFQNALRLGADEANTGTNATFTINGLETTRKSNTFTISGVTFTLKKDSVTNGTTSESSTVNIKTDTEAIVKTVKDFVGKYNEIIDKINGKISEKKDSKYEPLTDEEKEALSEKEIEKWEEIAKKGLLRRDSILSGALDKMRSSLYSEVSNSSTDPNYNQLAEIGITTTKNYLDRGKLEIDEDKLKAAIDDNPEAIYQLFMADGDTSKSKGLARRLRDDISSTIKTVEERAGNSYKTEYSYTMGKQLLDYEDQIGRFEDRLAAVEQRYWNQFNAMEKAMQNLNNQSNQLLSYLGMGQQQ